jgi:20S proteasome alpha/beta subunit
MELYLRVISLLVILTTPAFASNSRKLQNALSHGTINILLANDNGIVLVTDSRATALDGGHFDTSVKLFRLDESTVCSIAGLAKCT